MATMRNEVEGVSVTTIRTLQAKWKENWESSAKVDAKLKFFAQKYEVTTKTKEEEEMSQERKHLWKTLATTYAPPPQMIHVYIVQVRTKPIMMRGP